MKNILCPIDFSEASLNGMEYAAHLSKDLSSHLSLFYVRTSLWPEAVQLEKEIRTSTEEISARLALLSLQVRGKFSIACDYSIRPTTDTVEGAIAAKARNFSLIVMGTNGSENLYQHVFGSTTYNVIEQSKCPVVFVPQGYAYTPVKMIVYAYDPDTNPIFLIDQLKGLAVALKTRLCTLHISTEHRSPETDRRMEVMVAAVKSRENEQISWSVDFQYSDQVSQALDQYMVNHEANWLALSYHHRSLLKKLFDENVVKQLARIADYPVLVFWH